MNSNIIPQGPTECILDGTVTKNILVFRAVTDCSVTAMAFQFPAQPANPAAMTAVVLPAGTELYYLESITWEGTAHVIYTGN